MQKHLFSVIMIILMLSFLELGSFLVYEINPFSIMGWQSSPKVFDKIWIQDKNKSPLIPEGWAPYGTEPRPDSSDTSNNCVAVFGDSFSHGDEVDNSDTWTHVASKENGCNFRNYGVGGYGIDQATVHYETVKPNENIILLGLTEPMFSRNFAASWIFIRPEIYLEQKVSVLKPYFYFDQHENLTLRYPWQLNENDVREYHSHDAYYQPYKMNFPYIMSLLHNIYYRLNKSSFSKQVYREANDPETISLAESILNYFIEHAVKDNKKIAIIFIPEPRKILTHQLKYTNFMNSLKTKYPNICIMDGLDYFKDESQEAISNMIAEKGHYNKIGNKVIGVAIGKGLKQCFDL